MKEIQLPIGYTIDESGKITGCIEANYSKSQKLQKIEVVSYILDIRRRI